MTFDSSWRDAGNSLVITSSSKVLWIIQDDSHSAPVPYLRKRKKKNNKKEKKKEKKEIRKETKSNQLSAP